MIASWCAAPPSSRAKRRRQLKRPASDSLHCLRYSMSPILSYESLVSSPRVEGAQLLRWIGHDALAYEILTRYCHYNSILS